MDAAAFSTTSFPTAVMAAASMSPAEVVRLTSSSASAPPAVTIVAVMVPAASMVMDPSFVVTLVSVTALVSSMSTTPVPVTSAVMESTSVSRSIPVAAVASSTAAVMLVVAPFPSVIEPPAVSVRVAWVVAEPRDRLLLSLIVAVPESVIETLPIKSCPALSRVIVPVVPASSDVVPAMFSAAVVAVIVSAATARELRFCEVVTNSTMSVPADRSTSRAPTSAPSSVTVSSMFPPPAFPLTSIPAAGLKSSAKSAKSTV